MAEKAQITEETSDRIERIRAAMAAGQKVSEEDKNWIEDLEAKQEIIQSALTEGRHVETSKFVTDEGTTHINWTEYVPLPDGTTFLRTGFDVIKMGVSEEVIVRTATYFEPGNAFPKGTITSFLSGGHERITGITGFGPGGEYAGLNIGDTRPSPVPGTSPAGVRPSSWDPANFGTASGGTGPFPGMVDPLQQGIDAFVNQALNAPLPGDQSGGPSQSDSSDSSSSDSAGAGLGSPGMRGTDGGDRMGDGVASDPGQGGGDDQASPIPEGSDPDAGASGDLGGGGDEKGDPVPEGSDPDAGASGDLGGGGDGYEPATPQGEVTAGEGQIEVGTFYTRGEDSDTYEYPSGATVEIAHDQGGDEERLASDDYYSAGSAPTPQPGQGGEDRAVKAGGGGGGSSRSESFNPHDPAHAASLVTQYDPEGAPIDYGDAADPFHDPVIPTSDEMAKPDEVTPLILVDPSFYEESATGPTTELEMVDSLMNTGNPLEENQVLAPGTGMPNTSEQELVAGDGMAAMTEDALAANEPDLAGAMEAPAIGEGAPGALSDDDPLP